MQELTQTENWSLMMAARLAPMSAEELSALPAVMPLVTAMRAWGFSESSAYRRSAEGTLPFETKRVGGLIMVTKAQLLESLGMSHLLGAPAVRNA